MGTLNKQSILASLQEGAAYVAGGLCIGLLTAAIGSVTGCNNYVLSQVDQDVATTASQPVINQRYEDSEQAKTAKRANKLIATAYGRSYE